MLSLTNPYARTATILVVASILMLAGIVAIGPSLAAGGPAIESKKVHATGTVTNVIIDVIVDKTVGDLRFTTRRLVSTFTGDIQGRDTQLQTVTENTTEKLTNTFATSSFKGTIAGKSGTFAAIWTIIADRSNPALVVFNGTYTVVAGSGQEDLEGICGGGPYIGSGPLAGPFTTTYDVTFKFGAACNSANP